jgi:hypothetical protein
MPRRNETERLELFLNRVEWIALSPVMIAGSMSKLTIKATKDGSATITLEQPEEHALRSLLLEVRKLDAPKEDLYLPEIIEIVRSRLTDPDDILLIDAWKASYDELQVNAGPYKIPDPVTGQLLSGRDLFVLWVYGGLFHDDYDKQQKLEALGPFVAIARMAADDYFSTLIDLANRVYCLVREVIIPFPITMPTRLERGQPNTPTELHLYEANRMTSRAKEFISRRAGAVLAKLQQPGVGPTQCIAATSVWKDEFESAGLPVEVVAGGGLDPSVGQLGGYVGRNGKVVDGPHFWLAVDETLALFDPTWAQFADEGEPSLERYQVTNTQSFEQWRDRAIEEQNSLPGEGGDQGG